MDLYAAIEAQSAALRSIRVASGYHTDLGLAVIWPQMPSGESPAQCIYRAGTISFDSSERPDIVRLSVTWAAIVTGEPGDLDRIALDAQEDLILALLSMCARPTITRLPIPEREPGSNSSIAAVTAVLSLAEVCPP